MHHCNRGRGQVLGRQQQRAAWPRHRQHLGRVESGRRARCLTAYLVHPCLLQMENPYPQALKRIVLLLGNHARTHVHEHVYACIPTGASEYILQKHVHQHFIALSPYYTTAISPPHLPLPPGDSSIAIAIALGGFHSCIIAFGGGVKCWGSNSYGQLGIGTTSDAWSPVDVQGARFISLFLI
jgi:hypothetical protein